MTFERPQHYIWFFLSVIAVQIEAKSQNLMYQHNNEYTYFIS